MKTRSLITFVLAVALSLLAVGYRFHDSSHSMGMLSQRGGKARHAFHLDPGRNLYSLIVTGTVLPPYHGAARVVLEGQPNMAYELHDSKPVIDFNLYQRPRLAGNLLQDLGPRERFAFWVELKPASAGLADLPYRSVDEQGTQQQEPLRLVFYDADTGAPLLKIPVAFTGETGGDYE